MVHTSSEDGVNGYTNGLNGHASVDGASPSSSGQAQASSRVLILVHSESATRLPITGVPEGVYGLAADLRDEFFDELKESGRYAQLIPEPSSGSEPDEEAAGVDTPENTSSLLLASYWLQFLAPQHEVAQPILAASKDYFSRAFLMDGAKDIHDLASKLDVAEKKTVIGAWIAVSAKLGNGFGARGKIWDPASKTTSLYAVFGGQGSNEYYWDEMEVSEFAEF